jgi:hypothetical protein
VALLVAVGWHAPGAPEDTRAHATRLASRRAQAPLDDAARAVASALSFDTAGALDVVRANLAALPPMNTWLNALVDVMLLLNAHSSSWTFRDDGSSYAPTLKPSDELLLDARARTALRGLTFITIPNAALDHGRIVELRATRVFHESRTSSRPTAIVLVGPPGAGKTFSLTQILPYLTAHCAAPPPAAYATINPDLWIEDLLHNNNAYRPLANYCNHETFLQCVARRDNLIFDATARQLLNTCGRVVGRLQRANYRVHIVVVAASTCHATKPTDLTPPHLT